MKTVLFMDDDPKRRQQFQELFSEILEIDFAETADDAIQLLTQKSYDWASLDHDMCQQHYTCWMKEMRGEIDVNYGPELCGEDVVDVMILLSLHMPKDIIIHSHNQFGVQRMADKLKPITQVRIFPFISQEAIDFIKNNLV